MDRFLPVGGKAFAVGLAADADAPRMVELAGAGSRNLASLANSKVNGAPQAAQNECQRSIAVILLSRRL